MAPLLLAPAEAALACDLAQLWQEQCCGPESFGAFGVQVFGHGGVLNHPASLCVLRPGRWLRSCSLSACCWHSWQAAASPQHRQPFTIESTVCSPARTACCHAMACRYSLDASLWAALSELPTFAAFQAYLCQLQVSCRTSLCCASALHAVLHAVLPSS